MENNGIFINTLNKVLAFFQEKIHFIYKRSYILQKIDRLILAAILGVFVLSIFSSSDFIGYFALLALFLTVIKLLTKKNENVELNLFETFLIIYFLLVIISLAGSTLFHLSLKGFFKTFTYLGFYFSAVQFYKNNPNKLPLTIYTIAACVASQGIIGFFQNFAQVGEISTWQDVSNINPEDVMTRVYGTLQPFNPNLFGGYMVAGLPCLLGSVALLSLEKKYPLALAAMILSIASAVSLVLSGCRGAYIGLFAIILCVLGFGAKFIWKYKKDNLKKIFISIIGAMLLFLTTACLMISSIRTRIISIFAMRNDSSTSFRFNVYQSAIQMIKDNWVLGIGVGNQNFREIYGLYMRTGFDALSAYSVYLELAVESGIFALLAFLAFLFTLIIKTIKTILKNTDVKNIIILITALTSIIGIMVHGFVDTIFFRPQIQFIFWTMVAFISASLNPKNNKCG